MDNADGKPIRVGAQTICWGESIRENLPAILDMLSKAGYEGAEIGVRHLDLERPDYYRMIFHENSFVPIATHTGGTFWDADQAKREMAGIEEAISFAHAAGFRFFALSGNKDETAESMAKAAKAYEKIGAKCRDAGLQLVYHNHDWEFKHDLALLQVLLENTSRENVQLLPDVAWIHRAGVDPARFLLDYADRVGYVHLKDYNDADFCELGRGEVPLPEVLNVVGKLQVDWLVVEQDTTDTTPEESMHISAQYLQNSGML